MTLSAFKKRKTDLCLKKPLAAEKIVLKLFSLVFTKSGKCYLCISVICVLGLILSKNAIEILSGFTMQC